MMTFNLIISIIVYAIATGILAKQWRSEQKGPSRLASIFATAAVIFHGVALYYIVRTPHGIDIGFFTALTFTAWLVATLLAIASFRLPVGCLGLLIYPFAIISILLRLSSDQQIMLSESLSPGLETHILFSILAYSLLSIAVAQSILLYIQDKYLHNKHPAGFLHNLPSLETMENMLFRLIELGVIALSISLLSGFIYLENMFAQHLAHKTVLSIIAWGLFVILLWGRYQFGWRGKKAIKWVIGAFTFLMLAYFGSKFVVEFILQ